MSMLDGSTSFTKFVGHRNPVSSRRTRTHFEESTERVFHYRDLHCVALSGLTRLRSHVIFRLYTKRM